MRIENYTSFAFAVLCFSSIGRSARFTPSCHSEEVARRPTRNLLFAVKNRRSRFLAAPCTMCCGAPLGMTVRGDFHPPGWAEGPCSTLHGRLGRLSLLALRST